MQRVFSHIYVVKFQYFFMFKANKLHFFLRKKSYHHYKVTGSNIIKNETEKKMEKIGLKTFLHLGRKRWQPLKTLHLSP